MQQTAQKGDPEPVEEDDEDDLKEVIKILNDQILKKSSEINNLKKKHSEEATEIEL